MSSRNFAYPMMVIPLLLLLGVFFPLLLYILPLLFYFAIPCLFAKPRADVPVSNRNVRDISCPRGPPRFLPLFISK
ncbi:MAG: hypothetical protein WBB73_17620 [Candidatus Aminicenantaceae bacterium]